MKQYGVVVLAMLAVMITAFSTGKPDYEVHVESGVFIPNRQLLQEFRGNKNLVIDHVSSKGFELYGPTGFEKTLDAKGIQYQHLSLSTDPNVDVDYPTYEQMTKNLQDLQARYPKIMSLSSLGKSVEGRELWIMKISQNVEIDRTVPEVKFISTMHGDEVTGRELMVRLIDDLGKGYGVDQNITALVNNTEIYIMPNMNPDGTYHHVRYNGHGVDLNRNFPDFNQSGNGNILASREPETQALMKFEMAHHFSLSANFHGGAEVVNYVWDSTQVRHPQDSLAKKLSLDYASKVPYMASSTEFENGITNGYDWYLVNGGMQDYTTYWYNDLHFTIELSGTKWPSYSTMDGYYRDNKTSLLGFLQSVHQGVGFKVSTANQSGQVEVVHLKPTGEVVLGTFPFSNSEFFKVLEPGKYRFSLKDTAGHTAQFEANVPIIQTINNGGNYVTVNLGNKAL